MLQESPRQRYRFRGTKGQRIILMPDGWPAQDHGCVANAQLSRGKTKVAQGAVGDWRLPRAGTYVLRIGDFCVDELDLRLRRHQQTKGSLRGTLPTRLTHQLLRSVRLRLPADRTVVLEQRSNGEAAYVTNAKPDGFPFLGCTTHVITAGLKRPCIAGDKVARRVIVSAPRPSKARVATIVPARVDGPAVTIEDPATTLVQVEIPGRTALRVEGNATPHASGERPWASLYSRVGDGDGWHLTAYESETADGARLPSGWTIDKAGTYVFQVNGRLAGTGPQSFAVRTSPNPPPGETRW